MKITESDLRKLIRNRLLFERDEDERGRVDGSSRRAARRTRRQTRRGKPLSGPDPRAITYTALPGDKAVREGVELNQLQINAWNWLSTKLPDDAVMTSGLRNQRKQDDIINNYADDKGCTGSLDAKHTCITSSPHNLVVARRVGTGHGTGEAFDVSGAPLQDIKRAVESATSDESMNVKFSPFGSGRHPSVVEDANNAVHVHIIEAGSFTEGDEDEDS